MSVGRPVVTATTLNLPPERYRWTPSAGGGDENNNNDDDNDDDQHYNFLKDKHRSDQSYLEKLNNVAAVQTSELRATDAALFASSAGSLARPKRGGLGGSNHRDHSSPFLYQSPLPPPSASGSGRNSSGGQLRSTPPIPPADKNMEVVVGKGRRGGGSASSVRSNSATALNGSGSAKQQQSNGRKPPMAAATSAIGHSSSGFKCEICNKKYLNGKDLDIHKLYCS